MSISFKTYLSFGLVAIMAVLMPGRLASQAPAPAPARAEVTFTKNVAPILQRSCVSCHRPGEIGPMSLQTWEDARPWARSIKRRVANREMPPWHVDRTVGIQTFQDDPSLSDDEIATIAAWVDAGAPQGNPADMPPQRQFPKTGEWQIGTPDLIIKFPKYKVAATGPDKFGDILTELPITEDRYIKAIQARSVTQDSHRAVHHALFFTVDASSEGMAEGGQFLVEYASGKNAEVYSADSGVLLKAGQRAKMSFHLHSIGKETDADVELGISLYPKGYVPKHIRWSKQLAQGTTPLDIPAGTISRNDGYAVLHKPARIIAFQPHMHTTGKRQCLEVLYPSSGARLLGETLNCANFNNNWHLTYNYTEDSQPILPAGTILHNISWHDNSSTNPRAFDTKNWVGNGQRTIDEMGFFWIGWIELTDEEYQQALAARKSSQQRQQDSKTALTASASRP